jgi:hypothetical protein
MPRVQWPLRHHRPCVEITLTLAQGGQSLLRMLLADTGAGSLMSGFELLLDEDDCLLCGGVPAPSVTLSGAYGGPFPTYTLSVQLPSLGFAQKVPVVGVPSVPTGFDGIACFGFLNRFTYGNFGDPRQFGLEM